MRRTLFASAILSLLFFTLQAGLAQANAEEYPIERGFYFGQTGHTVQNGFWDFYRENGGTKIFGFPISRR